MDKRYYSKPSIKVLEFGEELLQIAMQSVEVRSDIIVSGREAPKDAEAGAKQNTNVWGEEE